MLGEKPIARIDDWAIGKYATSGYYLSGVVSSHPRVTDGHFARTSLLLSIDFQAEKAETANTIYQLGKMKEESHGGK